MTISVLDTTELRWFVAREVPPDVWSWFTVEGRTGLLEERVDSYRMDGRSNRGVKRRFQETLELKVRRSVGERLTLDRNLHGRLETWRRWSPADGLVERDRHTPWVDVDKRVVKRRFSVVGREISLTEDTRAIFGEGCDVEVTAVAVGGVVAWSFAFAAFGPTASHRPALVASWASLVAERPIPPGFGPFAGSSGYPQWLAGPAISRTGPRR